MRTYLHFYENHGDSGSLRVKKNPSNQNDLVKSPNVPGYAKSGSSGRPKWPTKL